MPRKQQIHRDKQEGGESGWKVERELQISGQTKQNTKTKNKNGLPVSVSLGGCAGGSEPGAGFATHVIYGLMLQECPPEATPSSRE